MFKSMKLGTKIGVGFAALIMIALILGGLATWTMGGVKTIANALANANVPEVAIANEIERDSLATMYEVRGYVYTEEKEFLDKGRANLEEVKKNLKDAKEHAAKFDDAVMAQSVEKAEKEALEYEQLLGETVAKTDAMTKDEAASLAAADKYMKICAAFLDEQQKELDATIKSLSADGKSAEKGASGSNEKAIQEKLTEVSKQIKLGNDIVDLGNFVLIGTWHAIATRDPKLFAETEKKFDDVNKKLDELKTFTTLAEELKQIEECRAAGKVYQDAMISYLAKWLAREEVHKAGDAAGDEVLQAAKTTAESGMDDAAKASAQAASSLATAITTMIVGLSVAVVVGVVLALFITRSITKPINRIITELTEGADQVNDAAAQVSTASQQLAEGNSEQASSLEETSSALEQMAAMTRQNAANAKQANELAGQAREAANEGDKNMVQLNEAMTGINDSSEKIRKIIKVIEEIAFQTNLLALNAAVEAARAGEHGKGFAVVADEVRNLAMRAAQAAKETTGLIEDAVHRSQQGTSVATEVGKSLGAIVGQATKVSDLINGISKASDEQAQGVDQVNTAVSQMDKVTQQNAAGAEESASAAEELTAQALAVKGMVEDLTSLVHGQTGTHPASTASGSGYSASPRKTPAGRTSVKKPAARNKPALVAARPKAAPAEEFASTSESADLKDF